MNEELKSRLYVVLFPLEYSGKSRDLRKIFVRETMSLHLRAWNAHPGWFAHVNPILEVDGRFEEILQGFTIEDIDDLYDSLVCVEDGRPLSTRSGIRGHSFQMMASLSLDLQ